MTSELEMELQKKRMWFTLRFKFSYFKNRIVLLNQQTSFMNSIAC